MKFLSIALLSTLTPGTSYLIAKDLKKAGLVILLCFTLISIFTIGRSIVTANGFILLNAGLLTIHLVSWLHGLVLLRARLSVETVDSSLKTRPSISILKVTIWFLTIWGIAIIGHINKSELFGFNLYHIPSKSMQPTLQIGDIVLIDTWFSSSNISNETIIVFKRHERGIILIKRIQQIRTDGNNDTQVFVVGDNTNYSVDSRRWGWIDSRNIIGIAKSSLFSIRGNTDSENSYPKEL